MQTREFPKLAYPIDTRVLSEEHRLILLAYDCIWRMEYLKDATEAQAANLMHDIYANLENLGYYIEHKIKGGVDRFDLSGIPGEEVFFEE